tara:strand:- start:622 stop:1548 length:927 start_codon:yes stop_codon:yes gene_type:complete
MLTTKAASYGTGGAVDAPHKGSSLRFPNAAFDADMDYVKIQFYDYTAPFSAEGGSTVGGSLQAYNKSSSGLGSRGATLHLYMPEDIEGQYGGNWDAQNFSNVAKGALSSFGSAAGKEIGQSMQDALDTAKETSENFFTKGTGVANAISSILGATNFGSVTVNDIFSVTTGQVLNPNTEVLYKGPKMRTFSLNFKMAPRSQTEANNIKKIIECFKYATLPRFGGAGDQSESFVRVPQLVDVEFMTGNSSNKWVTQYKPSVITDFNVSYTPDGAWATLPNGAPVATSMTISFQETKMVYANEVTGDGATY